MIKIRINNTELFVTEGSTVLQAASSAGHQIPVLCYKEGVDHYTSCMVCIVKDLTTGSFLPACSSIVRDGMDLDVSGEDVKEMRKKSLDLLISEHRAECEAPCRIVCPAGYNIPLFNRYLTSGDYSNAIALTLSEAGNDIRCTDCKAFCENACRRKKVDQSVSIKNLKIFISKSTGYTGRIDVSDSSAKSTSIRKRFSSRTGKIDQSELLEWLKECENENPRFREIENPESASLEASSCMHCDCRAAEDCALRQLAEEYNVKDNGAKVVNAPIKKKINRNTGLVFENAKCIKCGLCVRVCGDSTEDPPLCFTGRGFESIISAPLTVEFDEVLLSQSKKAAAVCPTGALSVENKMIL